MSFVPVPVCYFLLYSCGVVQGSSYIYFWVYEVLILYEKVVFLCKLRSLLVFEFASREALTLENS